MKVYLAEHYGPYYDGGDTLVGIFSTYEKAWEAIHQTIREKNDIAEKSEYGDNLYSVSEFGVIGVEIDKNLNLL